MAERRVVNVSSDERPVMALTPRDFAPDMDRLERDTRSNEPLAFAPPAVRQGRAIEQVKTFGELPSKELDDIETAAEKELASLKADLQDVRDAYVRNTARIRERLERWREGVRLSKATLGQLREQCLKLDDDTLPIPGKAS